MHSSQETRGLIQIIMLRFVDLILTKIPGKRKIAGTIFYTVSQLVNPSRDTALY